MTTCSLPEPVREGEFFVHTIVLDNPVGTTTTFRLHGATRREADAMLGLAPRAFRVGGRFWGDLANGLEAT